MTRSSTTRSRLNVPQDAARQFLELFYPIHYQAGIGVEDALRGADLSRHQTAILWLIHAQGTDGRQMRRKDIVAALSCWFEVSNAAITKALRGMATPPLALVQQTEDPNSGREKIVHLTPEGEDYLQQMIIRGTAYVQRIVDGLSDEQIVKGIDFFERISEVINGWSSPHQDAGASAKEPPASD